MNKLINALAIVIALLSAAARADWIQVQGEASAISIGASGDVWIVGTVRESGGFGIYHWDGIGFAKVAGVAGVRIAVDPFGNPWVVDSANNVRHWNGRFWAELPGWARDVAVGANGAVWGVGLEGGLYRLSGGRLEKMYPGGFVRIVVGPDGEPWPIDEKQQLVRRGQWGWEPVRSDTRDAAISADGSVWAVDTQNRVQLLSAGAWIVRDGRFRAIAVGPDGLPWGLTADNRIFRMLPGS